jgi:DNA repair protein SbcC/Rad50
MPYRESALDFTGIHLAVITGDNGNGKSAIVDAMTWALWGEARAASDDDLIHANQTEMEVEFDFKSGNEIYRIIRKRSKPKKKTGAGQSVLEFQIQNGDIYRPITGNTISQTQEKIISVLHMDYDTFINSAFLRQGHADEFTRQAPAKRKEVLASILGLGIYDTLEEKAREQARAHEADNAQLENTIAEINNDLAKRPEYTAELEKADLTLREIDVKAKDKEAALGALRQKKEALERIKAQLDELQSGLNSKAADLRRWQEQGAGHLGNIKNYEAVMARREEIETGYARFTENKKSLDDLDRKFRQQVILDKQKNALERKIDQAKNEVISEHTVIRKEITRLEAIAKTLPDLKNQIAAVQAMSARLADAAVTLKQKEQALVEAQSALNKLEAEVPRLEKEIGEAEDKLALLAGHLTAHTEAKCPLCEQELTREGLELIDIKYKKEKADKTVLLSQTRAAIKQKKADYDALLKDKAYFESKYNEQKTRNHSQGEITAQKIKEAEESAAKIAELNQEAAVIEQRLSTRDYAVPEQQVTGALENEIAALDYSPARHEEARVQQQKLAVYEREKHTLDEAARLIEQEKAAEAKASEAALGLQDTMSKDNTRRDTLSQELTGLPQALQELAQADNEYKTISGQRAQAQEAVGSVRARLERLTDLEKRKKELEARIAAAAREQSIYRDLSRAFGKNGIQALIIDAALPEIADEANRLLARLTDNRMTVKFETQRTTKKDILKETLDITIADELGTRDYEMFSGGEAFRINFAIRIALSRLLARRAGAPLPTLIIDEGFGTQDSTGMEKLKEAINSIQDDFDKILVITHMEELKDAFPNRIDVVKTADGSTISVS